MGLGDMELGPCQISFGTAGAEVDLGRTEGDVVITWETDIADLKSDQYGTKPEDQVITGMGATIKVPLAENTKTNWALALNQSVSVGGHLIEGASIIGTKLYDQAESLLLKKYVDGVASTDEADWIRFPRAAPTGNFSTSFGVANQRIIEVTFTAYPDRTSHDLYYIGDESES